MTYLGANIANFLQTLVIPGIYLNVLVKLAFYRKSWSVIAQTQESDQTFSAVSTISMMV